MQAAADPASASVSRGLPSAGPSVSSPCPAVGEPAGSLPTRRTFSERKPGREGEGEREKT